MGMPSATFTPWHIVNPISPVDVEGHVLESLGNGEVASGICNFGQLYDSSQFFHNLFLHIRIGAEHGFGQTLGFVAKGINVGIRITVA